MNFLKALWGDDRGQSTTEYILILSVVVLVALRFKKEFGGKLSNMLNILDRNMGQAMEEIP